MSRTPRIASPSWYVSAPLLSCVSGPPKRMVPDWRRKQNLEIATVKIGIDLGVFRQLSETEEPLSLETLAERSGADAKLLSTNRPITITCMQHMITCSVIRTNPDPPHCNGCHPRGEGRVLGYQCHQKPRDSVGRGRGPTSVSHSQHQPPYSAGRSKLIKLTSHAALTLSGRSTKHSRNSSG